MSTVTPPPPPPPTAPVAAPAQPPTVVVQQPPPALLSLDVGAKLDVQITGADAQGRVLVDTPLGRLALQTTTALPTTGPLQLQIQSLGTQVWLLVTAIHGKAPATALRGLDALLAPTLPGQSKGAASGTHGPATASGPGLTGGAATQIDGAAVPVQLTQGAALRATLLQPAVAILGKAPLTATAAAGAAPQTPGTQPHGTHTLSNIGQQGVKPSSGAAPRLAGGAPVTLPAGSVLGVRALSIQPNAGATPPPLSTTAPISVGARLSGVVTASSTPNQTVVQTHVGPVSVATTNALPSGTLVELEITQLPRPQISPQELAVARRLTQGIAHARHWPALDETLHTIADTQPAIAQQLVNAVLPGADANLAGNLLFFLFALRSGDVRNWLGDAPTRALERLKPALLGRLRDDFSGLSRVADDPPGSDGRLLPVPFANGPDIEQIRLWLRRHEEDEDDEDEARRGPGTRFVVDVELTRLGRLQLDGFVQDGNKHFDLIVRTERRLTDDVQNGIRQIFEGANEISGISGGLAFQAAPANFVDTEQRKPDGGLGLIV